jgi:hypothetical protein
MLSEQGYLKLGLEFGKLLGEATDSNTLGRAWLWRLQRAISLRLAV